MPNFTITRFADLAALPCPCGTTRRAFADDPSSPATVHLVEIKEDARSHYHKKLTEIYVILEGSGAMELDGELHPVTPMTTVMIRPDCRHRAVGKMKILNIAVPAFDPADEWFD